MSLDLNLENAQKVFDISIVLSKTLELIFEDNNGIVLEIPSNTTTFKDWNKLVVYKKDGAIQITGTQDDINEGTLVKI